MNVMAFMSPPASGGGDFVPILAYKANQGRLYTRDRVQDAAGNWDAIETEVTKAQPAFALDFGALEVGWCHFVAGMAPLWLMVPYGQAMPDRPASPGKNDQGKDLNYRQGFRLRVAGNAIGGVREFAGNSAALINGMNEIHSEYERATEAAMGKIPVVKMIDTITVKTGQSTNFQPVFQIVAWVDRPDVLGPRTVPAPRANAPVSQMPPAQVAAMAAASVPAQQGTAQAARARAPAMADSKMPF
jgi:hypothetical protein